MLFQLIKFFRDAAPTDGGAGTPAQPNAAREKTPPPDDPEPQTPQHNDNAALLEKIAALETKISSLTPKSQEQKRETVVPEWAKSHMALIEQLTNQVTALQSEKTTSARRAVFAAALKAIDGLPEYYISEVIDGFENRKFSNDAEFEAFKTKKIEAAAKVAVDLAANSLSFFPAPKVSASSSSANKQLSKAEQQYIDSLKARKN